MAQTLQQLQDAAKAANTALATAQAQAAAEAKAKDTPRAPEAILADLFTNIAGRLGNRPDLRLLITEYRAATKQDTPPAK